jgi:hypothetical protein
MRPATAHPERVGSLILGGCNPYPRSMNDPLVATLHRLSWARILRSMRGFLSKVRRRLLPGSERVIELRIRAASFPI